MDPLQVSRVEFGGPLVEADRRLALDLVTKMIGQREGFP
jgi:hypothetical protein